MQVRQFLTTPQHSALHSEDNDTKLTYIGPKMTKLLRMLCVSCKPNIGNSKSAIYGKMTSAIYSVCYYTTAFAIAF